VAAKPPVAIDPRGIGEKCPSPPPHAQSGRYGSGGQDDADLRLSRAWFFVLSVLLVVLWAPSYFLLESLNTWQLIINTATTIVTFPAGRAAAKHPETVR
jgi:Low affinity iron permease